MYVIGTDGIYRSTNNGIAWLKQNTGLAASNVTTLCRNSLGHLFLQGNFIGTVGGLYRSTNNGENWESINAVELPQFYDFYQLINDSNNILYGISDDVYRSTDEGKNWTNISDGLPGSINYILALSSNGDIFCGTNFGLYKSISSVNSVKNDFINPNESDLQQNYPNPFNPKTTIRYQLPMDQLVTIKIYDILGKEVATLVNEEKPAGNYNVNFNALGLSSGIYFYKLQSRSFVETKKMILLK
jgi:ligand-binding sensor domain-containing protein